MNLTRISIERPVFAWMLMGSLVFFGLIAFRYLGVSGNPDVDFPIVSVAVTLDGASPEVMESDVVDVIENAVMGVEGLQNISSSARYGQATITIEFDLDRKIDVALQEVQTKISQVSRLLPKDIDPPVITKQNPEDQPILWVALSGKSEQRELMRYARDSVITQFQMVPGVGDVFFGGYISPNIRIWVDGTKLQQYELSIDDVVSAINREHVEVPAGLLQDKGTEYTLRVIGEAKSAEELEQIVINRRGGQPIFAPIKLKNVARVEVGLEDVRRRSRVLGENAVGIGIRKQRGTNAVEVADLVKAKMAEMNPTLPNGLQLGVNFDSTVFIKETVAELKIELVLAAILTGLVCWLFLGSMQSTINTLLAIPTSLIGTFIAIKAFGFTLNTFTFLALILSVGIVVDDAIMILENIIRHRQMGKSKRAAAQEGTDQISFAALATTLAIVAIFLPVAFMKGIIGKFFFQFGIVLSVAVGLSLLEALTLTPMRCSQFLESEEKHGPLGPMVNRLAVRYSRALKWCLHNRWKVLLVSTALFLGSFIFAGLIKKEQVPSQDQGIFMARLSTKVGSSIDHTDALVREAEDRLKQMPDIKRFFVAIGGFGGGQVNTAIMFFTMKPHNERTITQLEQMDVVRKSLGEIKGLRTVIQDLSTGGFSSNRGFPIEFSVRGPDWDHLVKITQEISKKMETSPHFSDVDSNYDEGMPEVRIRPNRERAAQRGVSVEEISRAVSRLIGGERVARYTENGKRIDVRVRLEEAFREKPETILNIMVRNNRGELVVLRDVADLEVKTSLVSITREARSRAIMLFSNVGKTSSQAEALKAVEAFRQDLPPGYSLVLGGSSSAFKDTGKNMGMALLLGIVVAYMILASQFNSFRDGFTVLLALPFSLTGAFFALWLGGSSLNLYSMIGIILLTGLVKKNAIMLVDFANQKIAGGLNVNEALMEACPVRLRPILMTSITIIVASVPSVLGLGPGTETRSSMSLAVIGGVIISTFFTLFVVPCAHSLMRKR